MGRIQNQKWHRATQTPDDLLESICNHVAQGRGLISWTKEFGVSYAVAWKWLYAHQDREQAYHAARVVAADYLAEQALQIIDAEPERLESGAVDNAAVTLQRARFDARRWICARLRPDRYGEVLKVEDGRSISILGALAEARQRVGNVYNPDMAVLSAPVGNRSPSEE